MGNLAILDSVIEIAQGKAIALRVLLIPNSPGYPCYHSLIVGQLFFLVICTVATLYRSPTISVLQDKLVFNVRLLLISQKKTPSNTGRTSALKNDIVSN